MNGSGGRPVSSKWESQGIARPEKGKKQILPESSTIRSSLLTRNQTGTHRKLEGSPNRKRKEFQEGLGGGGGGGGGGIATISAFLMFGKGGIYIPDGTVGGHHVRQTRPRWRGFLNHQKREFRVATVLETGREVWHREYMKMTKKTKEKG